MFASILKSTSVPNTYTEALSHDGWCRAMHNEIQVLNENKTWTLINLLIGKRAVQYGVNGCTPSSSSKMVRLTD